MKVNLDFTSRNKLRILAGIAADTSHHLPEQTISFPIFNFQGGNHFMQGNDSIPSQKNIEIGLDVTPLLGYIGSGETARFFWVWMNVTLPAVQPARSTVFRSLIIQMV